MTDADRQDSGFGARIVVDPEPSPDEMLAILEVLRSLRDPDDGERHAGPADSRWTRTARLERLRSGTWPPQMAAWENR
jgi:hypothetical protein